MNHEGHEVHEGDLNHDILTKYLRCPETHQNHQQVQFSGFLFLDNDFNSLFTSAN
jgi:hypothetical protein